MTWQEFEEHARKYMTIYFDKDFIEKNPDNFPKRFDLVSLYKVIVCDAKYLTMVHGRGFPPAKMMEISGHVWLLEKVNTKRRFLVFGNQKQVPVEWLNKYGNLPTTVEFYFLDAHGQVENLREYLRTHGNSSCRQVKKRRIKSGALITSIDD